MYKATPSSNPSGASPARETTGSKRFLVMQRALRMLDPISPRSVSTLGERVSSPLVGDSLWKMSPLLCSVRLRHEPCVWEVSVLCAKE